MPQNQIVPFATGDGANTLAYSSYYNQSYVAQGFQPGVASSAAVNTVLRQVSTVAAGLAQFVADNQSVDVLDDGIPANFEAKFAAAVKGVLSSSSVHFGIATGTADGMIVLATPPMLPSTTGGYQPGSFLVVKTPSSSNATTAPTVNANSIATIDIVKPAAANLAAGDIPASSWILLFFDGVACYKMGFSHSDLPVLPAPSLVHAGDDSSGVANTLTVTNLSPSITSYGEGQRYQIKVANTTTGATSLNITAANGTPLGNRTVIRSDGTPTQPGDLIVGQIADLIDDGTNAQIAGLRTSFIPASGTQVYSTPGTYTFTVPAGVTQIKDIRVWGGGGGGGGSSGSGGAGSGGGGGGYAEMLELAVVPGTTLTIVVGAGGSGGTSGNGGNGGTSSVAITGQSAALSATGGGYGSFGAGVGQSSSSGGGGAGSGPGLTSSGGGGSFAYSVGSSIACGIGGAGAFGGGSPTLNVSYGGNSGNFPSGGANGSVGGYPSGGRGGYGLVILEY